MSRGTRNSSDDDDWDSDEDADRNSERSEAIERRKAAMPDDERRDFERRFDLFRSRNCQLSAKEITDMMQKAVPGAQVFNNAGLIGSWAARLFVAELIETARRLSGNNDPLTPDLILIALSELESHGKIPGKGPGVKRSDIM